MTIDLARRLDRVGTRFLVGRVRGIEQQPGNPSGVVVHDLPDGAIFLAVPALPLDWMNTTYGAASVSDCERALSHYTDLGVKPRFAILPGDLTPEIADCLTRAGLRQTEFSCVLYGLSAAVTPPGGADQVRSVWRGDAEDMDLFLDVFLAGFDAPEQIREGSKANMRHWSDQEGFHLFIAEREGNSGSVGRPVRR